MSFEWTSYFWNERWSLWGARRPSQILMPIPGKPPGKERRQAKRFWGSLLVSCREISLLGSDAWPAKVRDISNGGIGLSIIQPFPPGTFLGLQLQQKGGPPGLKLLVKVIHATRQLGTNLWVLGCEVIRELPADAAKPESD
jgi:hypothetical protein